MGGKPHFLLRISTVGSDADSFSTAGGNFLLDFHQTGARGNYLLFSVQTYGRCKKHKGQALFFDTGEGGNYFLNLSTSRPTQGSQGSGIPFCKHNNEKFLSGTAQVLFYPSPQKIPIPYHSERLDETVFIVWSLFSSWNLLSFKEKVSQQNIHCSIFKSTTVLTFCFEISNPPCTGMIQFVSIIPITFNTALLTSTSM